ncbi:dTDP-4-amino-4,6-dideoxygalactose transaminase [Oribacterium sp. WCC10]|nr:dTDP-4-amino-4,6-dideoxygalactose transaminase [Oribacterium sp. WCC10]
MYHSGVDYKTYTIRTEIYVGEVVKSMVDFLQDERFKGIKPFEKKIWLSSPTMHGDEQRWVDEAIRTNWVSTVGENINEVEKQVAEKVGRKYAVALASGTAALHLAIRLCGEKLYGMANVSHGTLEAKRVFCSDMTFDATVNPVCYEGGIPVFIDTEKGTWNMDPEALEKAFEIYPEVKLIVVAHLYGTPGKMDEIRRIADAHGALIVEDAAESFGASYKGKQTGCFGNVSIISGNGNKIITGSSGGFLLTDSEEDANKVRKWSTQSREDAAWYQHEELGYNYRMSNIIAGILRGQMPYLEEHIAQKKAIYERYKEGLKDLPVQMNPYDEENSIPNFWLSCMIIDETAMCRSVRGEKEELWCSEKGEGCPGEILAALKAYNAEGRPVWKPMHMQPIYRSHAFVTKTGNGRARSNAYINETGFEDIGADIFRRGVCLPSDNKMTAEEQERVIEIIHRCFG